MNPNERALSIPFADAVAMVAPERLIPKGAPNDCCRVASNLAEPIEENVSTQIYGKPERSAPTHVYAVLRISRVCRACNTRHRFLIGQDIGLLTKE